MPLAIMELHDNHSIAYCMLSYMCAYYRHYYPIEFITAFLNNAANQDDINNGTQLAGTKGIKIVPPKYGLSRSGYFYNTEKRIIAKGVGSVKGLGINLGDELYELSQRHGKFESFSDLLICMFEETRIDTAKLDALIKIGYFSDFGNQRELLRIVDMFMKFKKGTAKKMKADEVEGSDFAEFIIPYATKKKKDGTDAKNYTLLDVPAILRGCEEKILSLGLPDLDLKVKLQNSKDLYGYAGYITDNEDDRSKLFVTSVRPLRRRSDDRLFAYNVLYHSIGSGRQNAMTVKKHLFDQDPISANDIIICLKWERNGQYFNMLQYKHVY